MPRSPWSDTPLLPVLAVLGNALLWGCAWWPLRALQSQGLGPLWATALVHLLVVGLIIGVRPVSARQFARTPGLWALAASAGITSAACNWAIVSGDVVRVVLLVNLAPLWTALFARRLLGEPLGPLAALRVILSIVGAALVLQPPTTAGPWWTPGLPKVAEVLGLAGGLACGFSNVLMRRLCVRAPDGMSLALAGGGLLVAGGLAMSLAAAGALPVPATVAPSSVALAGLFAVAVFAAGRAMRFGVVRLNANAVAAIMLNEVLFATGTSVSLGASQLNGCALLGGVLVVAAAAASLCRPPTAPRAKVEPKAMALRRARSAGALP